MNSLKEPCLKEEEKEKWQSGEHTDKTRQLIVWSAPFILAGSTSAQGRWERLGRRPRVSCPWFAWRCDTRPSTSSPWICTRTSSRCGSMPPLTPSAPDLNNLKISLTDWFQCLRGVYFWCVCVHFVGEWEWGGGEFKVLILWGLYTGC